MDAITFELEFSDLRILLQGHVIETDLSGWVTIGADKRVRSIDLAGEWQSIRGSYARLNVCPTGSKLLYQAMEAAILSEYADEITEAIASWAEAGVRDTERLARRFRDYL